MLVTEYVGFRQSYLHQFLIRQFRCHVSTLAEVSTILQAVPDSYQCNEHGIEVHLLAAMKCCMCLREGRHSPFNHGDPLADGDHEFDVPNNGFQNIFVAGKHDANMFRKNGPRNVVSYGNQKLTRHMRDDEVKTRKRKVFRKRPAACLQQRTSRCVAAANVHEEEVVNNKKRRTSGIFGAVDMRTEEILCLGERMNAECKEYKNASRSASR